MPRRKKYPKLPNGYGSIKKLSGKNRRNPFGVYPPATELIAPGQYAPVKAICYVDDYMKGFSVLTAWHAGNYYPGFERTLNDLNGVPDALLADYSQAFRTDDHEEHMTFKEIFEGYYADKFKVPYGHEGRKKGMEYSMIAAFKNCTSLHNRAFDSLVSDDLQVVLDKCTLKHSSLELILTLYHQMYRYARKNNIVQMDYSEFVEIFQDDDDEKGVPFTMDDISLLWSHQTDEMAEMLLIMCYSGFRVSAYTDLSVDLRNRFFQGGVKTAAGKNRIVPIHSAIYPLVKRRLRRSGVLIASVSTFRKSMYEFLLNIGIERHTPHDCRHTFNYLCDKYYVSEKDKKCMLGHAFQDVTNKVYMHRDLDDLRKEIEKIQVCR